MKILVAPMSAMGETSGPFSRAAAICNKLIEKKHNAALCAAEDVNFRRIEGVKNYYAPVPSPFGAPMFIGKRLIKIASAFKIQEKKKVNSFEQVLYFAGAISRKQFYEDVFYIRKAIRDFKPDAVYAEFRIAAIVAAKLEGIKVVTGYSFPVQSSFASNPEYSKWVKRFLAENGLPPVNSALDIFDWADLKIDPSSYELEPVDDDKIVFTGPFFKPAISKGAKRNKIIAYMGYGAVTPGTVIDTLTKAFEGSGYDIYIATKQVKPFTKNNINVSERFDFSKLMPEAAVFINHGGQNSIMTGLMYGVPQIVCPGGGFERRYNARSVVKLGAGVSLEAKEFDAEHIKRIVGSYESNNTYSRKAETAGKELLKLGGADSAVEAIEKLIMK